MQTYKVYLFVGLERLRDAGRPAEGEAEQPRPDDLPRFANPPGEGEVSRVAQQVRRGSLR